jgi:RNA polymerase sigma-70 factor, ECF subfamily
MHLEEEGVLKTFTDADIIASSETDPGRFGAIFDRHFVAIYRYLRPRVGRDLAEDLASETLAIAFRRRAGYDLSREDARPWLYGIAANLIRHHRRYERRQLLAYARAGPVVDSGPDAGWEAIDDRIVAHGAVPALARALAALKPAQREVLLLHAWANLTYEQIAEALDVPVGTVRSRLARARRRIRELLAVGGQFVDGDRRGGSGDG